MKELAELAATGIYDSTQRLITNSEFQQMFSESDRIAKSTDFKGVKLLDGTLSGRHAGSGTGSEDGLSSTGALKVHFGTANDSAENYYYVRIGDATLAGLGLRDGVAGGAEGFAPGDPYGDILSISTQQLAQQALTRLDKAIVRKNKIRAHLGATQNRLENTVTNLTVQAETL